MKRFTKKFDALERNFFRTWKQALIAVTKTRHFPLTLIVLISILTVVHLSIIFGFEPQILLLLLSETSLIVWAASALATIVPILGCVAIYCCIRDILSVFHIETCKKCALAKEKRTERELMVLGANVGKIGSKIGHAEVIVGLISVILVVVSIAVLPHLPPHEESIFRDWVIGGIAASFLLAVIELLGSPCSKILRRITSVAVAATCAIFPITNAYFGVWVPQERILYSSGGEDGTSLICLFTGVLLSETGTHFKVLNLESERSSIMMIPVDAERGREVAKPTPPSEWGIICEVDYFANTEDLDYTWFIPCPPRSKIDMSVGRFHTSPC